MKLLLLFCVGVVWQCLLSIHINWSFGIVAEAYQVLEDSLRFDEPLNITLLDLSTEKDAALNISKARAPLTIRNAICKGAQLMARIKRGGNTATRFSDYSLLQATGWGVTEVPDQVILSPGVQGPSQQYGWESKYVAWEAERTETEDEPEWKSAEYSLKFNVKDGIFASSFLDSGGGHKEKLSRLSDVGWLGWKNVCEKAGSRPGVALQHYLQITITNADTLRIANAVRDFVGQRNALWPGRTFSMDSDEGHAILGTPNGLGLGWMIIEHQEAFGSRIPVNVTVWKDDINSLYLMFTLDELAAMHEPDPDTEMPDAPPLDPDGDFSMPDAPPLATPPPRQRRRTATAV